MGRLMFDSTQPALIPADAPIVAYYVDGQYAWSSDQLARFTNSLKVSIACFPQTAADILDVEQGCAAPSDVPGWLDRYAQPNWKTPTVYVNRSNWDTVRAAVGGRRTDYWLALPGAMFVPAGAVAVQFDYPGPYDVSMCLDEWPRAMTPDEHQTLIDINIRTALLYNALRYGNAGVADSSWPADWAARFDALGKAVANLQVPPANLQPVLDAIAALKADLDALTLRKA